VKDTPENYEFTVDALAYVEISVRSR